MINIAEITRLTEIINRARTNPVMRFVAQFEEDLLEDVRLKNLEVLFDEARKFKVRYIYVGPREIAGCEGKSQPDGVWPAMWAIAKNIGFPGSCGNTDQYQCMYREQVFPEDAYGGWDLKDRRKLSLDEVKAKKFNLVVTKL